MRSNSKPERLKTVIDIMNQQRECERERVRDALKQATVPLPDQILQDLIRLNPLHARDILRDHPGHRIYEKYESYRTSLAIFEDAIADLLAAIGSFESSISDESLLYRTRETELERIQRGIQKELFATTSAIHALVDHSRRVQKRVSIPGYTEMLSKAFGDDGLHEFVIGLRTLLHHLRVVRPGWRVQHDFRAGTKTCSFTLSRDALRAAVDEERVTPKQKVEAFLNLAPEEVDLREVFESYRSRATNFHRWFFGQLDVNRPSGLIDYERCLKESRDFASRLAWKALVGNWINWEKPPNPYDYLDRYLSADELEAVLQLGKGTKEQVDYIIELVDREKACDHELRELAYRYFEKALGAAET